MGVLIDIVKQVANETGAEIPPETVEGVDPASRIGLVIRAVQQAARDTARKFPVADLRFRGSLTTVAKVNLHEAFGDFGGDGVDDNALCVVNGSSKVSGASDHDLEVDASWKGMLFHVAGDNQVYRVLSVDLVEKSFLLADLAGVETNYNGTTKSTDSAGAAVDITDAYVATNSYATAQLAQNRYLLPANFKAPIGSFENLVDPKVMRYRSDEMFDNYVRNERGSVFLLGSPDTYTIRTAEMVSGRPRLYVEFYPYPSEIRNYPFRYEGYAQKMTKDDDSSGFTEEMEDALLARAKYHVFKNVTKKPEMAAIEDALWREIVGDEQRNPIHQESAQFQASSYSEHFENAYDL